MKPFAIISLLFISLLNLPALAQEKQIIVPYTLADRDRAKQIEAKLGGLDTKIDGKINSIEAKMEIRFENVDKQFVSQQKQIEDLKTLFYGGFSILISLFLFMFGYMIWDRRTAMRPALEQASRAMLDNRNFSTILRDYSKKHPDLADILRTHGML